jgi:hypothetical protein
LTLSHAEKREAERTNRHPKLKALVALYGPGVDREAILSGKVPIPEPARDLVTEIGRYTGQQESARNTGS